MVSGACSVDAAFVYEFVVWLFLVMGNSMNGWVDVPDLWMVFSYSMLFHGSSILPAHFQYFKSLVDSTCENFAPGGLT